MLVPNKHASFQIPRKDMPQLLSKDVKDFLKHVGVKFEVTYVNPLSLIPTQNQFNFDKIRDMDLDSVKGKFILVSQDGYVLDGHHRWLRMVSAEHRLIPIVRLPWPLAVSLEKMRAFHKSFTKEVHEEVVAGGDSAPSVSVGGDTPAIDNKVVVKKKKDSFKLWRRNNVE